MHSHERISKEHSHALVDLVAESPHGVQVVAGEGQLPMPPHPGSTRQGQAGGLAAHRDHEVGAGQQLGGDGWRA
jgi:hypothetical protein